MVKRITLSAAAVLMACSLGACRRNQEEAVRQGVIDYLAKRSNINVSAMNVAVDSVVFHQDEAEAVVSFSAKGASPSPPMTIRYTLERQGSRWVVKNRADSGGNPHGGAGPGAMGANPHGGAAPATQLPPGHPPVGAPSTPAPQSNP